MWSKIAFVAAACLLSLTIISPFASLTTRGTEPPVAHAAGINLLANPGLEATEASSAWPGGLKPTSWSTWSASGKPQFAWDTAVKAEGAASVSIGGAVVSRGAITQTVQAQAMQTYRLTYRIKTDAVTAYSGARARVQFKQGSAQLSIVYAMGVQSTRDWQRVEFIFTAPPGADNMSVQAMLESGTGTVWYDDFMLETWTPAQSVTLADAAVTVAQGEERALQAVIEPADASSQSLIWTAYDPRIATVTPSGVVRGISPGTTKVAAETPDGKLKAVASITVTGLERNGSFEATSAMTGWSQSIGATGWSTWTANGTPSYAVDASASVTGSSAVRISASKPARGAIVQEIGGIEAGAAYRLTARLKTSAVNQEQGARIRIQFYKGGTSVGAVYTSALTGTTDWASVERTAVAPAGADKARIELFLEHSKGTVWADDVAFARWTPIGSLTIREDQLHVQQGKTVYAPVTIGPADASPTALVWESSNPAIAAVDGGFIEGIALGQTVITVRTADGSVRDTVPVQVVAGETDRFDALRASWRDHMLGEQAYLETDPLMNGIVAGMAEQAQYVRSKMLQGKERRYLWPEADKSYDSAGITTSFRHLTTMAKAFVMEGSPVRGEPALYDAIMDGLDWMLEQEYFEGQVEYGNWWNWEIGGPQALNNLLVLLDGIADEQHVRKATAAIQYFLPDPSVNRIRVNSPFPATGANLVDNVKVYIVAGALAEQAALLETARNAIGPVFDEVTSGDGFYADGSFIQHTNVAYTGSYGNVLLSGIGEVLHILHGTDWEVTDPDRSNVYKWVETAFEPLMTSGAMMEIVRGRAISRAADTGRSVGHDIIDAVILLAQSADGSDRTTLLGKAKSWIEADTARDHVGQLKDLNKMKRARELLADESVAPATVPVTAKVFANMDKAVQQRPGYSFGLSLYSSRTLNYEYMNDENRKGWYTSEGMTYLYNDDLTQYDDGFWPTVDAYRLPGTTVDTRQRGDGDGQAVMRNPGVGGAVLDGQFAAVGMDLQGWSSTLTAKKAWFMLDNEIVALGAGITSTDNRAIETIVENRKLFDANQGLSINGEAQSAALGWTAERSDVSSAYLSGKTPSTGIGYYFPGGASVKGIREARTASWSDINGGQSRTPLTRNYVTLWMDHGANPAGASYAYAILPNRADDQVNAYAANPDFEVIANTAEAQVIREHALGISGGLFWAPGASAGGITVSLPAAVMVRETEGEIIVAVSDPSMLAQGAIDVELALRAVDAIEADAGVTVTELGERIKLSVEVGGAKGRTFEVRLAK
ncbi:polysaccharide lyase family 8 super-sandwich domain-containing protein [Paenibacillus methanolicus]|nr:polysaccharide lyase family 8 super-sandwich domain-containing protein [Paenibacillus methanolicus]